MKKLFALSLALVMTLSLAACGGKKTEAPADTENKTETETETPTAGDVKVAVVLKTLASEYWGYVETGCKAAAKDLGVDVVVVGPGAESDIEGQVSMIEQQIGAGCDAIVCAPNDAGAAQGALQAAIDAGIPVLAVDTNVGIAGQTSFVGTSNVDAAYEGGKWAIEQVGTDAKAPKVVIRKVKPVPKAAQLNACSIRINAFSSIQAEFCLYASIGDPARMCADGGACLFPGAVV